MAQKINVENLADVIVTAVSEQWEVVVTRNLARPSDSIQASVILRDRMTGEIENVTPEVGLLMVAMREANGRL